MSTTNIIMRCKKQLLSDLKYNGKIQINVWSAPNPKNVFSLNKISVFFLVFQCKNFLNRSNPRFSVPSQNTENRTKKAAILAHGSSGKCDVSLRTRESAFRIFSLVWHEVVVDIARKYADRVCCRRMQQRAKFERGYCTTYDTIFCGRSTQIEKNVGRDGSTSWS